MMSKKHSSILAIGAFLLAPIASSAQTDNFQSQYEQIGRASCRERV